MAGPTGYGGVGVMSHLFIMGPMTLTAITNVLIGMFELGRPRMANHACNFGMRGCGISKDIDEGVPEKWFLGGGLIGSMAIKTQIGNFLGGFGIIQGNRTMTLHAALIFRRQSWQFRLVCMTEAAFFPGRSVEIGICRSAGIAYLIVGIMAVQAVIQSPPLRGHFTPMAAVFDFIQNLFMAGRTLIRVKKILQGFVDIAGIRMAVFCTDIAMAFLAGELAVSRYMEGLRINQPPCLRRSRHQK
jgi:hypothetical protein